MFSLVHFSRVFPYIHPYLFPIEPAKSTGCAAGQQTTLPGTGSAPVADASISAEDAALCTRTAQTKRLKSLRRRHLLNLRKDALTYSGAFRHAAG